jgi:hypothetical protein
MTATAWVGDCHGGDGLHVGPMTATACTSAP